MAPSLPFELIIKIIEHAYYWVDSQWDRWAGSRFNFQRVSHRADAKTLSACAAVCKQWSIFARKLLFFQVTWRSKKDLSPLAGAGGVGACIRSLSMCVEGKPYGFDLTDFIGALSHCPALYHLGLRVGPTILELTALEVAQLMRQPVEIRALELTYEGREPSRVLYQLIAIWPSIQFLMLHVEGSHLAPPPADRPPFSLYELRLTRMASVGFDPYPESIVRWLLPPIPAGQRGSLHILTVDSLEGPPCGIFREYAPYMRSLAMRCPHSRSVTEILPSFSALEELFFEFVDCMHCDSGLVELPKTIQHFRFGLGAGFPLDLLGYAIKLINSGLPQLRLVSVDRWSEYGILGPAVLHGLADVCDPKGVELVFDKWGRWQAEYPVPVGRFPRDLTLENLYRMNAGS